MILVALMAVWSLTPESRGDYLGKSVAQWQSELTNGKDAATRRSAAFALGKMGTEAFPALTDLAECARSDKEDAGVRETATFAIGQIVPRGRASAEITALLCKLALGANDVRIQRSALVALGSCGGDQQKVRDTLDKAMADSTPAIRQNAVWALGEICRKTETVPLAALRKGLSDKSDDKLVKRDAALALGKILTNQAPTEDDENQSGERQRLSKVSAQARDAMDDLLACAGHDYVELRKAALGTLVNLVKPEDAAVKATLIKSCKDDDFEVRCNAALALATIGGDGAEAAVPVLREALQKGDVTVRRLVVLQFRNLGEVAGAALPDLLKVLSKPGEDKLVKRNTAVMLEGWKIEAPVVVPALVARLVDRKEAEEVRVAAAVSLQKIGACEEAARAIPRLVDVLADSKEIPKVRDRVLWALTVDRYEMASHDEIFTTMTNVLLEKGLRNAEGGGRLLRYHCAYLLGMFKQSSAPREVFPALQDFLDDPKVVIYLGRNVGTQSVKEGGAGQSNVSEKGGDDGRIMAVQALEKIGYDYLAAQQSGPRIIEQLKSLRSARDANLREQAAKLLKSWRIN
jgi:HEAT repeat protein